MPTSSIHGSEHGSHGRSSSIHPCDGNHDIDLPWYCVYGDDFYSMTWDTQLIFTFYNSLQVLLSADISPKNSLTEIQFLVLTVFLFFGALENAYIMGTWTVIVESLGQRSQHQADLYDMS